MVDEDPPDEAENAGRNEVVELGERALVTLADTLEEGLGRGGDKPAAGPLDHAAQHLRTAWKEYGCPPFRCARTSTCRRCGEPLDCYGRAAVTPGSIIRRFERPCAERRSAAWQPGG